jgi:hypothetical protein
MSITVVRRWARVFVTWCGARATDEVWLLRIAETWKIARLVRDVLSATFPRWRPPQPTVPPRPSGRRKAELRIAVLGSGNMGAALGRMFAEVMSGVI